MATEFEYVEAPQIIHEQDGMVLRVPAGIRTKVDLLVRLADVGHFPEYFGANWDALLDCLRDLSWIRSRKVMIVHDDVPLRESPSECRTYLGILKTALVDWSEVDRPSAGELSSEWQYVDHELRVIFPSEVRTFVASLVNH